MTKKRHSYNPVELISNVIAGRISKTKCGKEVLFTRESFQGDTKDLCGVCFAGAQAQGKVVVITTSWTDALERVFTAEHPAPQYTIAFKIKGAWK